MKPATNARQALLATLLTSTVLSSGCASNGFSLASMNPFAKTSATAPPAPGAATTASMTESIASTTGGATNQIRSLGATAKSALGKTTNAVTGVFSAGENAADESATDPLSLSNKPANVGPEVYVANGQLWESTGDFGKAMESYTKALESEPNNSPALTSIARLHFRQGNHKLAAEFFGRAIAQSPDDAGLHNDLGLTLSKLGDHAGATKSLEKALEIAPGTSRYANNLASVKFEAGETSSAYQVLSKNNKPAVAHFNMAYLHFKNGQMNEARGHLNQALESNPQAAGDAAVQRAVDRSRDMLAQIEQSMSPIAQAAPQATVAGGQALTAPQAAVRQASQSGTLKAGVAPAAPMAPAMSAITSPAAKPQTVAPSPSPSGNPLWGASAKDGSSSSEAKPVKPVQPAAAPQAPSAESSGPSFPFALPDGFTTPQ